MAKNTNTFEVIIIGGSYAGLSAAMALGRSLRNVLVIDSGLPCNLQTPYSHNFLTQDGITPEEIIIRAKYEVQQYHTIQVCNDLATEVKLSQKGFCITTQAGKTNYGKKLIFATGIKDIMADIPGFSECWGISVVHCPYCHGYEYRNQKTAIMANGDRAIHIASLVNNLTNHLTILTNGTPQFSIEQITKLKSHNIEIIKDKILKMDHSNGHVENVNLANGTKLEFDAVYASIPFIQQSAIPASLGCEFTDQGYIKVDSFHKTSIAGIFACGDNSTFMRSVANAVSTGNFTGAVVNKELTEEHF